MEAPLRFYLLKLPAMILLMVAGLILEFLMELPFRFLLFLDDLGRRRR